MALWEEHTGIIHPSFYDPASMDCVLQMRSIGQTNWEVRGSALYALHVLWLCKDCPECSRVKWTDDAFERPLSAHKLVYQLY